MIRDNIHSELHSKSVRYLENVIFAACRKKSKTSITQQHRRFEWKSRKHAKNLFKCSHTCLTSLEQNNAAKRAAGTFWRRSSHTKQKFLQELNNNKGTTVLKFLALTHHQQVTHACATTITHAVQQSFVKSGCGSCQQKRVSTTTLQNR